MRSHQNSSGSSSRRVGGELGLTPLALEWLDSGSWRMPSGKALAEFALQAGFLAPLLLKAEQLGAPGTSLAGTSVHGGAAAGSKQCGKGSSR